MTEYDYYDDEINSLEDPGKYYYKIQIHGGNSSKTKYMNITKEQLEAIRAILKQEETWVVTIVEGGILQEMLGKPGNIAWINVDYDCLEGGSCPICDEYLSEINQKYKPYLHKEFPFIRKKLVSSELLCVHCNINWSTDAPEYEELPEIVKKIFGGSNGS